MTRTLITCANRTGRAVLLFGAVIAVLGVIVALIEGWSIGEGLWWAEVTASTVGYGDLSPATLAGRLITGLLVIPIGLVGIGVIVGRVAATVIETKDAFKHEEQEQIKHDASEAHRYAEQTYLLMQRFTSGGKPTRKGIVQNLTNPQPERTLQQRLRDVTGSAARTKGVSPSSDRARRDDRADDDGTSGLLMYGAYAASVDGSSYDEPTSRETATGGDGGANAYQPDTSTSSHTPYVYDGGASYGSSSSSSNSYDSGSSSSSSYDSGSSSGGGSFGD